MNRTRRILVVDDESSIRCLLSDVLSDRGFEVTQASDGQESLDQMEKNDFDLVITDIQMPRLDGISMLMKMDAAGRKEKVIVMTANPFEQRLSDNRPARVITRLLKPFQIKSFLDIVIAATANGTNSAIIEHQ
ncbi:Response regulator receiver domain protein [uncultured Desulfobacterium sp.]|uniref:Response regulator receiver domain protein n=1 Tax=uncultured Desulfobacterium sp. TaxID=201089 RepID=A0A445MVS2_9BACT|nr:Response regulator receiver domain protein [uncultured Desulfobacterium sp.]